MVSASACLPSKSPMTAQALFVQRCLCLTTQYPSLHTQPESSAWFPKLHALLQYVGQAQKYLPLFLQQWLQCELGPVDSALFERRKEGFSQLERNKGSHESDGHFEVGRWHHFKTQRRMENSLLKYIFCFYFWPHLAACGTLVLGPWIKSVPPALEGES